jgi:phage terminase large subunit-like protein
VSTQSTCSEAELLSSLSEAEKEAIYHSLTPAQATEFLYRWDFWARPNQRLPTGDSWNKWLLLAGRGFGKTRTGAEAIRTLVGQGYSIVHLVGATAAAVRDVMIEHPESGLMRCFPSYQRPSYEPSKREITFHTGAVAKCFSAEEPERLRGPACQAFWADELAAWERLQDTWDMLSLGFRVKGKPLRGIISTTPKPLRLIKYLRDDPNTIVTRGSTYENRKNLAPGFFDTIIRRYEGTRLGRQELMGEVLEDFPGALWTHALIDQYRRKLSEVPTLVRVVVAIDPAVTANEDSDETGIGCVGLDSAGHCYVLEDASMRGSPKEWAWAASKLFLKWECDRIVAETNNGGDLVEANLRSVHPDFPYRKLTATRGKIVRAEPAAGLYEQGRVHHVGVFEKLEDQMCEYVPGIVEQTATHKEDGKVQVKRMKSPDRMDWLVWALYDLVISPVDHYLMRSEGRRVISPY